MARPTKQQQERESIRMFTEWDGSFRPEVLQPLADQRNRLVAAMFGFNRAKEAVA
jgi:hypothetical protein